MANTATAARVLGNSALALTNILSAQGQTTLLQLELVSLGAVGMFLGPWALLNTNTLNGGPADDFLAIPVVAGPRLLCIMLAQKAGV